MQRSDGTWWEAVRTSPYLQAATLSRAYYCTAVSGNATYTATHFSRATRIGTHGHPRSHMARADAGQATLVCLRDPSAPHSLNTERLRVCQHNPKAPSPIEGVDCTLR